MDPAEADRVANQVTERFPYPLAATYYRAFFLASNPSETHDYLIDLFELALKYCSAIMVSQYFQDDIQDPGINASLLNLQRPSLGHWQAWLRDILALYRGQGRPLVVPELALFYKAKHRDEMLAASATLGRIMSSNMGYDGPDIGNLESVTTQRFFELLGTYRNELAHGSGSSGYDRERAAGILAPCLTQLMSEMSFLSDYPLVYVSRVEVEDYPGKRGTRHYAHHLTYLTGQNPRISQRPQYLESDPASSRELYLLDKSGDFRPTLSLHPLLIYKHCENCNREQAFLLNAGADDALDYVSYPCTHHFSPTEYQVYMRDLLTGLATPALMEGAVVAPRRSPPTPQPEANAPDLHPVPTPALPAPDPTPTASEPTPTAPERVPPAPLPSVQPAQPSEPAPAVVEQALDPPVPAVPVTLPSPPPATTPMPSSGTVYPPWASAHPHVQFAGFWRRLGAYVMDIVILGALYYFMGPYVGLVGSAVYGIAFIAWSGSTLGMKVLSLKVTKNGELGGVGVGTAGRRYLASILSGLALGIGYLATVWHPQKQCWHDSFAGTWVVLQKSLTAPAFPHEP